MFVPMISTVPSSGFVRPASKCSSVLLPEPLAPMTATNSPRANLKLTPRTASTTPPPD